MSWRFRCLGEGAYGIVRSVEGADAGFVAADEEILEGLFSTCARYVSSG